MDSTEFNKIAGAGLAALLVFLLLNFFSGKIYGTGEFHGGEHVLAFALPVEQTGAGEAEAPQIDLLALFSNPDLAVGEKDFRACTACHSLKAGENKVGPSLHNVVGRAVASAEGFGYSDAMAAHGGTWTAEELFHFLGDPKGQVPGTKMSFAGIKDPQERADVIAYINQQGDAPIDLTAGLPVPEANAGATEGSATDGAQPQEDQPAAATPDEAAAEPGQEAPADSVAGEEAPPQSPPGQAPAEGAAPATEPAPAAPQPGSDTQGAAEPSGSAAPAEQSATAPAEPADQVAAAPAEPAGQAGAAAAGAAGLDFAQADAAAGEKLFRRCAACHKVEEGKNGVGPSLWGVIGRPVASVDGYSYSPAMKEHGGDWTPANLAAYLENPKGVVPGTKMVFAGLKDAQDRIDVIAYLNQHAASPQPLQ